MSRIEKVGRCKDCKGTGLVFGMAERDGFAVQCHTCKGTGKFTYVLEWEEFDGRVEPSVKPHTVMHTNTGFNEGGLPYEDWKAGGSFIGTEPRSRVCPAWHYQNADYAKKPTWKECLGCGAFPDCKHFPNKSACWERWDKEFGNKDACASQEKETP